jgi:hypothetical protein
MYRPQEDVEFSDLGRSERTAAVWWLSVAVFPVLAAAVYVMGH